jgi:hypothetical protein
MQVLRESKERQIGVLVREWAQDIYLATFCLPSRLQNVDYLTSMLSTT